MAVQLSSTKDFALNGIKVLVYAGSGAGKTYMCRTLPPGESIIISAESGLLSLRDVDIPVIVVSTLAEVKEAYAFLLTDEGRKYRCVGIDSITEIAEKVLAHEKSVAKDPRQAYGALIDHMTDLIKAFRDLPGRTVYMSAKQDRVKDDATGGMLFGPMMPGSKLGPGIPYLFDLVAVLHVGPDDEDGNAPRMLQTARCPQYVAKDRSGALDKWEVPDLALIERKIVAGKPAAEEK